MKPKKVPFNLSLGWSEIAEAAKALKKNGVQNALKKVQ